MEEILNKAKQQLEQVIALAQDDLGGIRTGRAQPNLVENLKVEAYETTMTLKELASITAPEPHSLLISPWDKTIIKAIEKAVLTSNLNLNPIIDNDLIRIQIPPLTEETRRDLVKLVYQKIESSRRLVRQVRNEIKEGIEGLKGTAGVSEDDIKNGLDNLQKLVDEFNRQLETLAQTKEKELMTV